MDDDNTLFIQLATIFLLISVLDNIQVLRFDLLTTKQLYLI